MPALVLLRTRHDEIEADFQHYYRINLGDLYAGALSLRRFGVLVYGLPPGSVTWRAQGGALAWSDETRAGMLTRHAIQQLQESFAERPSSLPLPEPPEWGHVEKATAKADLMERRMQVFLQRQKGQIAE